MSETPKRILHVFSTLSVGGPQRRFADYVARSKAGFVNSVYAMDSNYDALQLIEGMAPPEGIEIVPKGSTFAAVRAARRILKQQKPDLLVTYNWGATEWALANRFFPLCQTIHIQDGFTEDELEQEIPKRRALRKFAYKGCHSIVVPSRTLEKLVKTSWGTPDQKVRFIPNGIDIERFKCSPNSDLIKSLGIDTGKKIVGTVAGLRPEKNVGRLIEAFSLVEDKHDDIQLVIVGDGVGMSALKMLSERVCKKDGVIFTGNLPDPESLLSAFDVFALSSDTEQMPLSVIEAMASSLPIASTDVGDVRDMVADSNKSYVEGKDAKLLADNISHLLSNPDLAERIGANNQEKARADYTIETMIDAYDQLFQEAIG